MKGTIQTPKAVRIPGLIFRRFKGDEDLPAIADVQQRSRDADLIDLVDTVEDVANDFRNPVNFDPHEDVLIVEINGTIIGYGRVSWEDRYQDVRTYLNFAHLLPDWGNKGIRRAMLRYNENRILDMAKCHPTSRPSYYEAMANYETNDWKSLIESEGYTPHRHNIVMVRSHLEQVPDLPLPHGIEVRAVNRENCRIVFDAAADAFRDERNFASGLWGDEGYRYLSASRWWTPELWQIAWDGDQVAGGVINFIDREENEKYRRNWGYTGAVFTRKPWRNRGIASHLLTRSFVVLRNQGVSEAALLVDTENPSMALKLYEKLGFEKVNQFICYRKPLKM